MLVERMIRAARLDVSLYEEVESDTTATSQAATVVLLVAIANAIAGAIVGAFISHRGGTGILGGIIGGIIIAFIGWIAWSYVTYFVGTNLFNGTATPGEMMRTIGFAQSPGVLNIITFIPCLGAIVALVVAIWMLIAGVIAVRQALDFETSKAILTVIIGWIVYVIIAVVIGAIIGVGSAIGGAA